MDLVESSYSNKFIDKNDKAFQNPSKPIGGFMEEAEAKKRKESINKWADSLEPNCVYFLCSWENTVSGAHCHREIIYKAFSSSKKMSEKIIPVYRHGEKNYKDEIGRSDYRNEVMAIPDVIHRDDDDIIRRERMELRRQIRNGDVTIERINVQPENSINRSDVRNLQQTLQQILEDDSEDDPPF